MPDISQDPFAAMGITKEGDTPVTPQPTPLPPQPVPTVEEVQASIASFAESMNNFDNITQHTANVRQQLLNKLLPTVLEMNMTVTGNTDPDLYAAQTRLYGEVRQLLNDMDTSSRQHVATKMKQKDQETNEQNSINAAEFLKQIQINVGANMEVSPKTQEVINQAIEEQFKERGCLVLDTELTESDSQLPDQKVADEF